MHTAEEMLLLREASSVPWTLQGAALLRSCPFLCVPAARLPTLLWPPLASRPGLRLELEVGDSP